MNIDFTKLLKMLLPTFMREGLAELITALGSVIGELYSNFTSWKTDMRLQAAITCQVMYLELILNYRLLGTFNRIITITDGDGVETDFVINQPDGVDVDSYRLIALLDKYKTYGKRYSIQQRQYSYEVIWSDYVCEKDELRTYAALWSDFTCEKTILESISFAPVITTGGYGLCIVCPTPPSVDVVVTCDVRLVHTGGILLDQEFIIEANTDTSAVVSYEYAILEVTMKSIYPNNDGAGTSFVFEINQ